MTSRKPSTLRQIRELLARDPGMRCSYCASRVALPFKAAGTGHLEWENAGWDLAFVPPDGEPVWRLLPEYRMSHRDHVHPVSKGGPDRLKNIVLACDECNKEKGSRPLLLFLASRAGVPQFRSVRADNRAVFAAAWGI